VKKRLIAPAAVLRTTPVPVARRKRLAAAAVCRWVALSPSTVVNSARSLSLVHRLKLATEPPERRWATKTAATRASPATASRDVSGRLAAECSSNGSLAGILVLSADSHSGRLLAARAGNTRRTATTSARPSRVLLLNDLGTPSGGAEIQIIKIRDSLRQRGVDARLFASTADDGTGANQADARCFGTTSLLRTPLQVANPSAYRRLRRLLDDFQPDVVHVQMFLTQLSPLILPLLTSIPSIYHVGWYRPVCPLGTKMLPDGSECRVRAGRACHDNGCLRWHNWGLLMGQRSLFRRWWQTFDRIIAVSASIRDELAADDIGPVEVMWNPVVDRAARPRLSSPPTVAYAGRLVPEKGVGVLLLAFSDAVKEIPDARLLILGDGPEREVLERRAADLGLQARVKFLGHVAPAEAEEGLASAWVQAVPSRWREPFGNVAAEAMMRGTAVVASASGGLAEFVQDGETGLLVRPGDPHALSRALVRLLGDRELAERMGHRGREFARTNLQLDAYLDRLLEIYAAVSGAGASVSIDQPRRI
jgi:glycosyltransferase involved in cell wall biosynthesis